MESSAWRVLLNSSPLTTCVVAVLIDDIIQILNVAIGLFTSIKLNNKGNVLDIDSLARRSCALSKYECSSTIV